MAGDAVAGNRLSLRRLVVTTDIALAAAETISDGGVIRSLPRDDRDHDPAASPGPTIASPTWVVAARSLRSGRATWLG